MRVVWQADCCKTKVFTTFFIHTTVTHLKEIYISSIIYSFIFLLRKKKTASLLSQQSFLLYDSKVCQPSMRLLAFHCKSRQFWNSYIFNANHQCLFVVSQSLSFSASDSPFEQHDSSPYHNESVYAWLSAGIVLALIPKMIFAESCSELLHLCHLTLCDQAAFHLFKQVHI